MLAVMKTALGEGNVELREIPEPIAPPGHVTIAVRAAGICGTDLHIYHDEFPSRPPVVLGHEIAGEIAEVGAGVEGVRPGDRVTTETYFSTCGACRSCREGRRNLCLERRSIGSGVHGGFTSYVVVPAGNIHHLPENVDFRSGALTEPLACVVHGAIEGANAAPGDVAVITGPGAIGLLTLQVVRAAGARAIILGTDADAHRLDLARQLGAAATANVQRDPYEDMVRDLTAGSGADIVYECSGAPAGAQTALSLVRRGGRYVQIGLFGRSITWDLDQICYREVTVTGSNASTPSAWRRALRLLAEGTVRTDVLVSNVYPITAWREAFDVFEQKSALKCVLQPVLPGIMTAYAGRTGRIR